MYVIFLFEYGIGFFIVLIIVVNWLIIFLLIFEIINLIGLGILIFNLVGIFKFIKCE